MIPILSVQSIDVFYGEVQALWEVSFEVQTGEVLSIVGSNGAGKTTTIKTISGLLKPSRGQILLDGAAIERVPSHRIVELGIAMVPEGRRLWPQMTVLENLDLGTYPQRARAQKAKTLDYVLSLFPRLGERRQQLAGTLSGGEQQMVAIGRGLLSRPRILMLDEPSLGLSPLLVDEMFKAIAQIKREGVTVLLVEQNVHQALELANHAVVLETGRVVMSGAAKDLMGNEQVKSAYLGM